MNSFVSFWLLITVLQMSSLISPINGLSVSSDQQNADSHRKFIMDELEEINNELDKDLLEISSTKRLKRSDIDARLLEIQAKLLLGKAFQKLPAGHGRFNFDKIGKRSVSQTNESIRRPLM